MTLEQMADVAASRLIAEGLMRDNPQFQSEAAKIIMDVARKFAEKAVRNFGQMHAVNRNDAAVYNSDIALAIALTENGT